MCWRSLRSLDTNYDGVTENLSMSNAWMIFVVMYIRERKKRRAREKNAHFGMSMWLLPSVYTRIHGRYSWERARVWPSLFLSLTLFPSLSTDMCAVVCTSIRYILCIYIWILLKAFSTIENGKPTPTHFISDSKTLHIITLSFSNNQMISTKVSISISYTYITHKCGYSK